MSDVEAVIFDFDGTIADTFELFLDIAKNLVQSDVEVTPDLVAELRRKDRDEILETLHISKLKALLYYRKGKQRFAERLDEAHVFKGVGAALKALYEEYDLGILTHNDDEVVKQFLHDENLPYFHYVESSNPLTSKTRALKQLTKQYSSPENVVYVGDQVSDVRAAHHADCEMIAVSWGYNAESYLEEAGAERLIADPHRLVETVQSL